MKISLLIISAPSGSGKSTLVNEVRREVPGIDFSISYTTRAPRGSEQPDVDYHYIARNEFERMIGEQAFIEHALVHDNYYGTAWRYVREAEAKSHDLILDIDVQGAAQMRTLLPEAVSIFIMPPSREELEKRLRRRSQAEGVSEETILTRLANAGREVEKFDEYDYILVNDHREAAVEALRAVILSLRLKRRGGDFSQEEKQLLRQAEAQSREAMRATVQPILASFRP